jgi:hypothetical protein
VFLGEFGSQAITLTLQDLPDHSLVTITFDLYLIRSWDGNTLVNTGPSYTLTFPGKA